MMPLIPYMVSDADVNRLFHRFAMNSFSSLFISSLSPNFLASLLSASIWSSILMLSYMVPVWMAMLDQAYW